MRLTDLRLVPAAAAAWAAAWLLVGAPEASPTTAIVLWMLAGVAISVAIVLTPARAGAALLAVAFAAGGLVATTVAARAPERSPPALFEVREFEVVLTGPAQVGVDRVRGTVGAAPVLVVGLELEADASLGATLRIRGHLEPVEAGGAIVGILVANRAETIRPPPVVLGWADDLRSGFRDLADQLPGDGGDLLTGLAIGDDAGVPAPLADAMTATSLSHLTAVSGANCAVVVGAAFLVAAALGLPKRARLVAAGVMLVAFVVLVTPQPSVVRAAVMAALALVALAVDRPVRGVSLLSVAVIVVIAVDPWAAREVGLVLSVLATAGLLLVAGPLATRLTAVMPRPVAFLVAIPAAAQLACQPVIVLIDPALPIAGIVANLLAGPAAPIATGFGLIACLLQPIAPTLALGVAWIAWVASSWIAGVATVLADAPFARMPWPPGAPGAVFAAFGSIAVAWWAMSVGRAARVAGAIALCWAVVVAGAGIGAIATERLGRPADWTIAQCDIGQGDAVLLRSVGAVALVDTGPDPALLTACLNSLAIDRIDLLVLTHFDHDHVGGIAAVVGRSDTVLVGPVDERGQAEVVDPLIAAGATVHQVTTGQTGVLGAAPWRVLWPPASASEPGNAASIAMRVETDPPIVLLADLGEEEQQRMLAATPPGPVPVVKVAHHGSADQSERLMLALDPDVALIGVGVDNAYGHPTPELIETLTAVGATVVRSDLDGLALLAPSRGGVALWRQHGADAAAGAAADSSAVAARLDPPERSAWAIVSGRSGGHHGSTRRRGQTRIRPIVISPLVGSHSSRIRSARDRARAVSCRPRREPPARPPPR